MNISVVILVYNLQDYVGSAIDSVFSQTRPADEIIVIDDCSTDGSAEVVATYGSRLRYIKMKENSGALLAGLRGIESATGDVVCMLDGDDVWAANKLAVVEDEFAGRPDLMLLSHQHIRVDSALVPTGEKDETHRNIERVLKRSQDSRERSDAFRDSILAQRGYWLGSAYAFRRSFVDIDHFKSRLRDIDPAKLRQAYLDLIIAPYLVANQPAGIVGYTPETHFKYRLHPGGSLSENSTVQAALRSLAKGKALNEIIKAIIAAEGVKHSYLQRRDLLISEYDYLADLYRGRTIPAMAHFFRLAIGLWGGRKTAFESVRLVSCIILRPHRFLAWKQARANRRRAA